jgi:FKBP-type peptidyl-prolyl cis-trans isomerase
MDGFVYNSETAVFFGNTMEKNKILQLLLPALGAAGILAFVLFLVLTPEPPDTNPSPKVAHGEPRNTAVTPETQRTKDYSIEKMSRDMPSVTASEFRDIGGGLKMMDVEEGTGDPCPAGATITAHYAGWLFTTGTCFDSSYIGKNSPLTYPLSQLIPGWQRGLPGMKPGGIRRLIIPPDLGYGSRGSPPSIPGGATLVFEFKLLEWK